jgi:hypothetical protein
MTETNAQLPVTTAPPPAAVSKWTIKRITMIAAGALIAVILLVFVIGVLLALLTDATQTAPRIQIIRDIVIIILALQGIVIVVALAILILQVARLINLLQNEVIPILENTKDTLNTAKGTVEFVSDNVTEPLLRASGFAAGLRVLVSEMGGIRRAIRREQSER